MKLCKADNAAARLLKTHNVFARLTYELGHISPLNVARRLREYRTLFHGCRKNVTKRTTTCTNRDRTIDERQRLQQSCKSASPSCESPVHKRKAIGQASYCCLKFCENPLDCGIYFCLRSSKRPDVCGKSHGQTIVRVV